MKASTTQRTYESLTREDLLSAYRWMMLSRRLDDKEIQLKNQSQIFFQISGAGHEAILVAAGMALKSGLRLVLPVLSRPRARPAARRDAYDMLLAAVGAKDDPASGGRMMPSHWSNPSLHIVDGSSATGTQCLHAAGCAEASIRLPRARRSGGRPAELHDDEVTYVSIGDGATGEGEFWEFLNTFSAQRFPWCASWKTTDTRSRVPPSFIRPAVTSPVCSRVSRTSSHSGRGHRPRAELSRHAGSRCVRARAERPRAGARKVVRPYSHSHSDDERLYKTAEERELEAARDPIALLASS